KYRLEVVAYDHKYVIAECVATVNRLIAKDCGKYVSILGGSVAKANEEAVNEAGVLGLTLAYAEGLVSPKNPLTFQCFPAPPETTTFWKWIKDHQPQIKRVASIAPNDDTGWWSVKVETTFVQKLGYAVVAKEFFERSMTDFNPILLRMLAQKPDAISVMASPAGSVGLIIKQARELGFKGRFVALHQIDSSVVAGIAGRDNVEGMWVHGYVQTPLPEKLKSWQQRYTKKFGEWNATSIDFTNPAFAFVAAVRKAQSLDPKKVCEAMCTVEFDAVARQALVEMQALREAPVRDREDDLARHGETALTPDVELLERLHVREVGAAGEQCLALLRIVKEHLRELIGKEREDVGDRVLVHPQAG